MIEIMKQKVKLLVAFILIVMTFPNVYGKMEINKKTVYDTVQVVKNPQNIQSSDSLGSMTLHVIPQSHIDLSWWWRYDPNTIHVIIPHTLETAFGNMEKFPDYTFTHTQVPAIEPLEEHYPELFYKLQYYIHNKKAIGLGLPNPLASGQRGRLAIGGGFWVDIDGNLPCGESVVRHILYGKRWFKHKFGIDVKTAWLWDNWTHPWTYPQILKKSGIESYMYWRTTSQEDYVFWWESPDGSKVLVYRPLAESGERLPPKETIDNYLLQLNENYGIRDGVTLIGVGNHGGGAIAADVERMEKVMKERDLNKHNQSKTARMIFSTPMQYTNAILKNSENLPVFKYELEPTIRGTYTTVGEIKKGHRYSENLLLTLEKFSSIASSTGINTYPDNTIFDIWKKLMLNQHHDPISGTDINPSIDDALLRYQQILDTSSNLINRQLGLITDNINTLGEGIPIVIFNPLSWQRTDVVKAEFELPAESKYFSITDQNNIKIPVQIINKTEEHGVWKYQVIFLAEDIPSMGYCTYRIKSEKKQPVVRNILKTDRFYLENELFILKIDSLTGCLARITDKQNNREVLDRNSLGNIIQIIEDFGDSEGFLKSPEGKFEFNRWTGNVSELFDYTEIDLIENGPVRATIQIKKEYRLARFTQWIHLYRGIDRIDFEIAIKWHGKNKMVKVSFPLNVQSDSATYDIPYGTIKRASLGEEHVAQKWVDISDDHYGVSLLNDSRYGHDITKNTIRLSLLRSPSRQVEALDNQVIHRVKYALYPHKGSHPKANVMQKGYEFNYPLIAVTGNIQKGILPAKHSFVEISPANMIISTLKKAEDSDHDLVLRFYETEGTKSKAKIKFSPLMGIDAVHKTDLLENEIEKIPLNNNEIEVQVGKFSIESFRLIKDFYTFP